VQAAWIGYFATTGLPTMDWIVADARLVPESEADQYSERALWLPDTYVTFAAPADAPAPAMAPLFERGHVTFGCYNNAAKIGPAVIALWARILAALPEARLKLRTGAFGDPGTVERFCRLFDAEGVDPARLDFVGHAPRAALLAAYNEIDIALDPFPFNGGITTVEALWMGVPVVTKRGDRYCGHHSESSLVSLGLGDLVAADDDGYVACAADLARDPDRLVGLRGDLRPRFARSTLGDNPRFVRDLEAALRFAWGEWCRSGA
jgi:predicted O-linked N-acetylglucosamine transferase (SPINDLY family)